MSARSYKIDVAILSGCWGLNTVTNLLLVSVVALAGHALAEYKPLALLPVALQWFATAAATVPAAYIMRRIGRRAGFSIGVVIGLAGAALAVGAFYAREFWALSAGVALIGAANGFNWQFRFAAAEVAPESFRARAISLVLAGGVAAALLGPTLAIWSRDMLAVEYAGSFLVMGAMMVGILCLLRVVRIPKPSAESLKGGRPLGEIAADPRFPVAVTAAVVSYAVMVLLMAITPLAMRLHALSFEDAALAIQWHVLGMYVPAFFTGSLIKRWGVPRAMLAGGAMMAACLAINLSGQSVWHFWVSLGLLGVGWNFMFVGATTLLTETHTPAERAKVQGVNDLIVFTSVGLATVTSGSVLLNVGWAAVNWVALPLVLLVTGTVLWLGARQRRAQVA